LGSDHSQGIPRSYGEQQVRVMFAIFGGISAMRFQDRKGGWCSSKPSSSSSFSIRSVRALPFAEIRETPFCRATRGNSFSVNGSLPPSKSTCCTVSCDRCSLQNLEARLSSPRAIPHSRFDMPLESRRCPPSCRRTRRTGASPGSSAEQQSFAGQ